MVHSRSQNRQVFALLLLLLATFGQITPDLHHHEEEHACASVEGTFVYLTAINPDAPDHVHGPTLRGMRFGDSHEHHDCSLCHLLTLDLPTGETNAKARFGNDAWNNVGVQDVPSRLVLAYLGRGPPSSIS